MDNLRWAVPLRSLVPGLRAGGALGFWPARSEEPLRRRREGAPCQSGPGRPQLGADPNLGLFSGPRDISATPSQATSGSGHTAPQLVRPGPDEDAGLPRPHFLQKSCGLGLPGRPGPRPHSGRRASAFPGEPSRFRGESEVPCWAALYQSREGGGIGGLGRIWTRPSNSPLTHTLASSGRGSSARPCGSVKRRLVARTECPQHLAGAHAKPAPRTRGSGRAQPPSGRAPPSHAPALTHAQAGGGAPRARARRAGWAVPQRGGEGGRTAEPRGFLPAGLASFAPRSAPPRRRRRREGRLRCGLAAPLPRCALCAVRC